MNNKKYILLAIVVTLICILSIGCEKKENESPTVRFLQPESDLIINNDTIISFVVEPYDSDGTIDRVEFSHNGTIVNIVSTSPYNFDWSITTEDNIGNHQIKAIAFDNDGANGEAETIIEVKSYLTRWVGTYEGISDHWFSLFREVNGQMQTIWTHSYRDVSVDVAIGNQDSCLYFKMTYNDSIIDTKGDLFFSNAGVHFREWGGGSSYGSLNIGFDLDSLHYRYYQLFGIPNVGGVDFDIKKKY